MKKFYYYHYYCIKAKIVKSIDWSDLIHFLEKWQEKYVYNVLGTNFYIL